MILALDASTKSTGWAVFENTTLIGYGCITANSTNSIKRIFAMIKSIHSLLKQYHVQTIVLEEVIPKDTAYDDKAKHHENPKVFKPLMWLQGGINFMVYKFYPDIKIEYLMPNSWRSKCGIHTGSGHLRDELKAKDIQFAKEQFGIIVNDDTADACGLGWAYVAGSVNFDWS